MNTSELRGGYDFTRDWFSDAVPVWRQILAATAPRKLLEVGSFEGRSACFLIDALSPDHAIELHCIDTFEGGVEHARLDMSAVEARFRANIGIACANALHAPQVIVHKGLSDAGLAGLLAGGARDTFDFIYIDGSHQAPDVLADAVLGFRLLRPGGVMIFDDYLWSENLPGGPDVLRTPKPAIDAFVNLNARQLQVLKAPLYQLFIRKTA
jgi:predicted O-methyltransferase YrrM